MEINKLHKIPKHWELKYKLQRDIEELIAEYQKVTSKRITGVHSLSYSFGDEQILTIDVSIEESC